MIRTLLAVAVLLVGCTQQTVCGLEGDLPQSAVVYEILDLGQTRILPREEVGELGFTICDCNTSTVIKDVFVNPVDEQSLEQKQALESIYNLIDQDLDNWHWYDKKIFELYRYSGLSIRGIAKETDISWVSIFNTLKNGKETIRQKFGEDYTDYKNQDFERIGR